MTDANFLLRAVLLDPTDDLARLAYADWLEESGESPPGRHETPAFIRRQVLPRRGYSPIGVRAGRWLGLNDGEAWMTRGFVGRLTVTLGDFTRNAGAWFAAHPIIEVGLSDQRPAEGLDRRRGLWGWVHPAAVLGFGSSGIPHMIPEAAFALLAGYTNPPGASPAAVRWYATEAAAQLALSRACVSYGRSLAGLPPLPSSLVPQA